MPREIITDWTVEDSGGGLSVMYFDLGGDPALQRQVIGNFWAEIDTYLSSSTSFNVRQEGRELSDSTGTLIGVWSDPVARTGAGAGSAFSVANTSQLLVRWNTDSIVAGRFVRGRTNVPGMDQQHIDGDWTPSVVSAISVAANVVTASVAGPGVWHRPTNGAGGSFHEATSASVWSEAAVQRRRRS